MYELFFTPCMAAIRRAVLLLSVCLTLNSIVLRAATLPTGFTESQFGGAGANMSSPTAMAFAPDGRLFVCQQGGSLRVIRNGALLATPFLTVSVNSSGERGLLGIAFDCGESVCLCVLHNLRCPDSQSRQPLYRQWRCGNGGQ